MASGVIELPDGRKFRIDAPDDETLQIKAKEVAAQFNQAPQGQNRFLATHPAGQFTKGLMLGLENAQSGLNQLTSDIGQFVRPESQPLFPDEQQSIAARDAEMQQLGVLGQIGGFAGEVAPSMVLPGGPTGGLVRRVAGGAAADAVASVADPVREGQNRGENVALAAGAGSTMRVLGEGVSQIARRISNARAGNLKSADINNLVRNADAEDIRIFFDDVTQSTAAQKASVAAETFGVLGTAPGRKKQGEEALAAAERWLNNFAGDADEYTEVIQSGVRRKLHLFQRAASRKYGRVVDRIGGAEVQTQAFDNALDQAIAMEMAKGGRANSEVISLLTRYKESPRGNFEEMIELRSDFNADIRNLYKGDNTPNKTAGDAIRLAQGALNDDMGEAARAAGAFRAWRDADAFYQQNVVQFKEGKLKNLLNEKSAANFDERSAWQYLMQAQSSPNPKRAQRMWQSLDSRGRAAVRFGFLSEALDAATKEGAPFSPARYASFIEKRMDVADQFFRGRSNDEIKGLVSVMRHIERAGQFAENPPTGNRLLLPLLATGATIEPGMAAGAGSVALTIKGLFQTQTGRNLLLAANTATPGSRQMDRIVEELAKLTARSSNQSDR